MEEEVTGAMFTQVLLAEVTKGKEQWAAAGVRLEHYRARPSAEIMHLGPYSTEGPAVAKLLNDPIADNGYSLGGKNVKKFRRVIRANRARNKMRTVIRQPVLAKVKAGGDGTLGASGEL